jgi:nucleoside-diphosphate-sugar epimerase
MKIFITGATGFIGANLALRLAKNGHSVNAIYRSKAKIKDISNPNLNWFEGDIMDIKSLEKAMFGCEQVYHIAAQASVWEPNPGDFSKFNVQGTIHILDVARKLGINNVVVTSTAGVFGPSINGIITEQSVSSIPLFTGYERSKLESERIIQDYVRKGMRIVIVNPTRVYGPGALNQSNSVTIMIKKYVEGKWHVVPGNGNSLGNYVFVDDVVNGHILAMEKGRAGERYILGGDNISYNQFFNSLKDYTGKDHWLVNIPLTAMLAMANILLLVTKLTKIPPAITPAHVRKFNYNWEVSCTKAKHELGYTPLSFNEGASKTIPWVKTKFK